MEALDIRCQNDRELFEKLIEHPDIRKTNARIAQNETEHPSGLRRRLLSSSVRLSRTIAPAIHRLTDDCASTLGVDMDLELYVFPSPQFNALCFKPQDGWLFVMFSSSLLEVFADNEMQFVIGHELGHHIYHHHDIPIGHLLNGENKPEPQLALELFAWSRYAEISADRAGAHCTHDLESVARALFKLASGIGKDILRFSLHDFLKQVDDMVGENSQPGQGAPAEDWFSTHPFSPLRVKALQLFDESEYERQNGTSKADLELGVQNLMSLMEPSYLEGKTEAATHMRRLLYAGAIAVANASDGISPEEVALFESFFGPGEFSGGLDVDRLVEDLPNRIKKMCDFTTILQRMQVIRDLCLVAMASGTVTGEERALLKQISENLSLSPRFVDRTISQQIVPD